MEFSLTSMWQHMGAVARGVVYALAIMNVAAVAVGVERLVAFVRSRRQSLAFALATRSKLESRDFAAVVRAGQQYSRSPLAAVVAAGVGQYKEALDDRERGATYDVVEAARRASERTIDVELARMRRGLGILATVGSTAPFVGLFGTVFGIINAFHAMGRGQGDLATIGPGIAEALVTTAFGIFVAIIGVWLYNAYTARVEALSGALQVAKDELVDFFYKDQGRPPSGEESAAAQPARAG